MKIEIPEDLKKRYQQLSSYLPIQVAVIDIREYQSLIERIAYLESAYKMAMDYALIHSDSTLRVQLEKAIGEKQ